MSAGATVALCAEPGRFRMPSAGDRLRANEASTVSWSLDPAAPARRDEMELVLSLDGGATFPIRVSGRVSTSVRSIVWRVPSLATERAVLALRAGEDEQEENEAILTVSEPFAIAADPDTSPEPLYPVADEWRTGDALDGAPCRTPSRNLAPTEDGPAVSSVDGDPDESDTPPAGAETAREKTSRTIVMAPGRSLPRTSPRLATPLPVPLRI